VVTTRTFCCGRVAAGAFLDFVAVAGGDREIALGRGADAAHGGVRIAGELLGGAARILRRLGDHLRLHLVQFGEVVGHRRPVLDRDASADQLGLAPISLLRLHDVAGAQLDLPAHRHNVAAAILVEEVVHRDRRVVDLARLETGLAEEVHHRRAVLLGRLPHRLQLAAGLGEADRPGGKVGGHVAFGEPRTVTARSAMRARRSPSPSRYPPTTTPPAIRLAAIRRTLRVESPRFATALTDMYGTPCLWRPPLRRHESIYGSCDEPLLSVDELR
jgi:hypothetical protein